MIHNCFPNKFWVMNNFFLAHLHESYSVELSKYKNSFTEADYNTKLEEMQQQQRAFVDQRESALFHSFTFEDLLLNTFCCTRRIILNQISFNLRDEQFLCTRAKAKKAKTRKFVLKVLVLCNWLESLLTSHCFECNGKKRFCVFLNT